MLISRRATLAALFAGIDGGAAFIRPANAADSAPRRGGTLKVAIERDIENFEPHKNYGTSTPLFQGHIYETLVGYGEKGELVGLLAESWTQQDPKTWVFKLRPNVKFHDGESFTADDVVYSIRRLLAPATGATRAAMLAVIADVNAPDPGTVIFTLSKPFGMLALVLSLTDVAMLKKGWAEAGNSYNQATNGTGPFKLAKFERNVQYRLERNQSYWHPDRPYLDAIEIVPIGDTPTRVNALLSRDVDMASLVPWERVDELEHDDGIALAKTFELLYVFAAEYEPQAVRRCPGAAGAELCGGSGRDLRLCLGWRRAADERRLHPSGFDVVLAACHAVVA